MSQKIIPKVNPWTGQKAKPKSDGKFFSILTQHYPHLDQSNSQQKNYTKLATLIQAPRQEINLKQYKSLIDIKKKVEKIDQILQWIDKQTLPQNKKQQSQNNISLMQTKSPIDSSFVYIPLHSGTIFHQILKQSSNLYWDGMVHDRTVKKIERQIQQMQEILNLNQQIMKNIIA